MAIVDAQVHIWSKGTPSPPHLPTPYLVEDAVRDMDAAGIDAAILHPPAGWDPDSNEQAIKAVEAYPERFAILGYPPLDQPDSPDLIASWKNRPGMLGYRFYFNKPHNRTWPTDGTLDWLWPAAEKAETPLALLAGDWLPFLGEIAEQYPRLKLTVDHMGALRGAKGDAAFPNMKELTALARYPNVAVKLTGGPFYADDDFPFKSLHQHYRAMYEAFGPNRLFWGTDITKMPCSWQHCIDHFQEIDWIPTADKKLIMGDAVREWLGWKN